MRSIPIVVLLLCLVGCDDRATSGAAGSSIQIVSEGKIVAKEDQYYQLPFEIKRTADVRLTFTLHQGPAIDVYFMEEADLNKWNAMVAKSQTTGTPKFYTGLSLDGLSGNYTTQWVTVNPGKYAVILDNTDYGSTIPPANFRDDFAEVSYKIEAR